jgi:hypothetical protein
MNRQNSPVPLIIVILAALVIFMVTSCKPENYKEPNYSINQDKYELDSNSHFTDKAYKIYTLEGCEYIVISTGSGKWGTHKGNCTNIIHSLR